MIRVRIGLGVHVCPGIRPVRHQHVDVVILITILFHECRIDERNIPPVSGPVIPFVRSATDDHCIAVVRLHTGRQGIQGLWEFGDLEHGLFERQNRHVCRRKRACHTVPLHKIFRGPIGIQYGYLPR